jgi:hypothetical protein
MLLLMYAFSIVTASIGIAETFAELIIILDNENEAYHRFTTAPGSVDKSPDDPSTILLTGAIQQKFGPIMIHGSVLHAFIMKEEREDHAFNDDNWLLYELSGKNMYLLLPRSLESCFDRNFNQLCFISIGINDLVESLKRDPFVSSERVKRKVFQIF